MDELAKLNLGDDLAEATSTEDASRWELRTGEAGEVRALMFPSSAEAERFDARLLWSDYPGDLPSLKFRNLQTDSLTDPRAWPVVRGFRPATLDSCVNWTKEGMALHAEWRTDPRYRWDPSGNPLLRVLRTLQYELDYHYGGRFTQ